MELSETHDPERQRLVEAALQHKRGLEHEVEKIAFRSEQAIKTALVIGGALAVTYLLVKQLTRAKEQPSESERGAAPASAAQPQEPSLLSAVGGKVVNAATLLLLDVVRERVSDFLKARQDRS